VRGTENASDHAPAWIVLRDIQATRRKTRPSASKPAVRPKRRAEPTPPLSRRPLLVIDGNSFANRSYHALPKTILRHGRKPAGAILGFANLLLRLYREEQPRAVLVAWDTLDVPTYRHEEFPDYQSGRDFDEALLEQLDRIPEFVAACGFQNAKAPSFEADDFLASAAKAEEKRGGTVLIASGDRDTFQLASDRTTILYPVRGGELARIGPAEVRARYGVDAAQVPDFIALRGDPSDKLPGAPGAVSQSTVGKYMARKSGPPGQNWNTFFRNHAPQIAAMDLFVVPIIGFELLYAFVIVRLARRDLVWINVTAHPTAEWIAQQITEAFLERGTTLPDP
jgi:DNA polymerase-1